MVSANLESPFHQAMANSALHLANYRLEECTIATQYHQYAVSSLREQLAQSRGQATDEILACIGALMCWAVRGSKQPFTCYNL